MLDTRVVPSPGPDTAKNPTKLYEHLRKVSEALLGLYGAMNALDTTNDPLELDMAQVREALEYTGDFPLNVEGLMGVLSDPQLAGIVIASTQPVTSTYPPGTLLVVTTAPITLYYLSNTSPSVWTALNLAATAAVDNVFTISDDADPTKLIRFEASTIATATTRVMTVPNVDQILAGRNVDNSFSVNQLLTHALDSSALFTSYNTNASGTSAVGGFFARGNAAQMYLLAHGAASSAVRCGITLSSWDELLAFTDSNGLLIDTNGAIPLVFGTNDTERMRIDSAGDVTIEKKLEVTQDITGLANIIAGVDVLAPTGDIIAGARLQAGDYVIINTGALYSDTGDPNGVVTGTSGEYYFRTDTPGTALQRIYVCTGGSAWTGIL